AGHRRARGARRSRVHREPTDRRPRAARQPARTGEGRGADRLAGGLAAGRADAGHPLAGAPQEPRRGRGLSRASRAGTRGPACADAPRGSCLAPAPRHGTMSRVSRRDDQLSQAGGTVGYLPLTPDEPAAGNGAGGDRSIGALVKDATTHMSTLIRAEVELAKAELVGEVKKGVKGSVLFIIALTVALYSSFFFFFFLAELLAEWLPR